MSLKSGEIDRVDMEKLKDFIRVVPNFPREGVNFYDITTLLLNWQGFKLALDGMESYIRSLSVDKLVGVEARGFPFAAALADRIGLGLALARKPGKLPSGKIIQEYELEYGTDSIAIHDDAIAKGERVVIVDDLIATGGTVLAACKLVEKLGGEVVGISTVIGLNFLPYESKLSDYSVNSLISYNNE